MRFNLKLTRIQEATLDVEMESRDLEQAYERASLIQAQLNAGDSLYSSGKWRDSKITFIANEVTEI